MRGFSTMLTCDHYHVPDNLEEALALWQTAPQGSRIVAGATDILPWAREGRAGDVHLPALAQRRLEPQLGVFDMAEEGFLGTKAVAGRQ